MSLKLEDLTEHMKKYRDAVVIVGPGAISSLNLNRPTREELEENFVRKSYKRQPEAFWKFYRERVFIDPTICLSDTYQNIISLTKTGVITTVINQNTDGMLSLNGVTTIELHGNTLTCSCKNDSSHPPIVVPYPAVILFDDIPTCDVCGNVLRPDTILLNDSYNDGKYHLAKEAIAATHTLIIIGIDYAENAILDLIAKFDIIRESNHLSDTLLGDARMLVAIYETKPVGIDLNEDLGYCQFQIEDTCDATTTRLLKGF